MIVCTDVHYRGTEQEPLANAAAVFLHEWTDPIPAQERTAFIPSVEPYISGQFFRREMPCLLQMLDPVLADVTVIVVDGYVWLGADANGKPLPGLGAHLFETLGRKVPVIGVAKTRFAAACDSTEVFRGTSQNPLYVSAIGVTLGEAEQNVRNMAGKFRIPDALKRVDQLSRL